MAPRAADYPYFDAPFIPLAHRGGTLLEANLGRENTAYAFEQAVRLGYRWLETDVHVTADGILIAFHDEQLDRVSDATGLIAELPWTELEQVRIGGEPIPTLDELFERFPEVRFNIDLKAPGAVLPLARTIAAHRAHDRVCVGSFSTERLARFRRQVGRSVATSVNPAGVAWSAFAPLLPRWTHDPGVAFQVPTTWPIAGREVTIVTPGLIARAHAAGQQVHVWTIDDPAEMHRLIDLGVDGLVTDRPDLLKRVCLERGLWP
ncbi:glycerophosphodiester phosphodiesterase [Enemella dayhoffiae]|uniref:Glycerophosphodiester phosphodiesterase n=1 Tax=Enemella dayhoffiae TaxID=2016507 RepID=A0A255H4S7_9ACTN|nr:glycerophosphodiester phosphodiesterase [Enemella dayhoffiae]OYO22668.1 glycerophosphodiester phosphodiesterase [Enemella dayhoffiae]